MTAGFRSAMSWLHTSFGLAVGWLLFIMFVTGACGYYRHEITLWMTPELHALAQQPVAATDAAQRAENWLQKHAASADEWSITLPDERQPALRVSWRKGTASASDAVLDPRSGQQVEPKPRSTRGGDFLYRIHFDLLLISPILARFVVGFCAMVLLVTLFSGVIVRGRLLQALFRLRRGAWRNTWIDLHNLTGIVALPFHVAMAYSGLVCLMILLLPWGVLSVYGMAGLGAFAQDSFSQPSPSEATPGPASLHRLDAMVVAAQTHWPAYLVGAMTVDHPNDRRARVTITRARHDTISYRRPSVVFDGVTGREVATLDDALSSVATLHSTIFGFHVGHFAGTIVRFALFVLGLIGAAMIASGLVLWTARRARLGRIDGVNAGVICGLPLAIAAYLWANQLLPASAVDRASLEASAFLWTWGAAIVVGVVCPARWRWPSLMGVAAVTLALTPIVRILTTSAPLAAPTPVIAIDVALVLAGVSLSAASARAISSARHA